MTRHSELSKIGNNSIAALLIAFVAMILVGCSTPRNAAMSEKQLFEQIKIGMRRTQVESLLGTPKADLAGSFAGTVFYRDPPKIENWESPKTIGLIKIVYSTSGVVTSKEFYGTN